MAEHASSLSADIINYLALRGWNQRATAKLLGVTDAYISLVRGNSRSFTVEHLEKLARTLKVPLGALIIEATKPAKATGKVAKVMSLTEDLLRDLDDIPKR